MYAKEHIEALGLCLNDRGGVECPHCVGVVKFNSGDPILLHTHDCPSDLPRPTYLGAVYVRLPLRLK